MLALVLRHGNSLLASTRSYPATHETCIHYRMFARTDFDIIRRSMSDIHSPSSSVSSSASLPLNRDDDVALVVFFCFFFFFFCLCFLLVLLCCRIKQKQKHTQYMQRYNNCKRKGTYSGICKACRKVHANIQ